MGAFEFGLWNKSLSGFARSHALIYSDICFLLLVEEIGLYRGATFVGFKDLQVFSGFAESYSLNSVHKLVRGGYLQKRGGAIMAGVDNRQLVKVNKAAYALRGKGQSLCLQFHKQYDELLASAIPGKRHGGFPRGAKRESKHGKMIREE